MRATQCFCLLITFLFVGCNCTLGPCGRRLHVSGHVLDPEHRPIGYAAVVLDGVKKETDENGCFFFGGDSEAANFDIDVSKFGYKPYRASKEYDFYEIVITLASENGEQRSSGIWHKLYIEELSKYKACSEK